MVFPPTHQPYDETPLGRSRSPFDNGLAPNIPGFDCRSHGLGDKDRNSAVVAFGRRLHHGADPFAAEPVLRYCMSADAEFRDIWSENMEYLIALLALSAMEIVLGIDNVVFIAILVGRLPESQRDKARRLGLALALVMRILLLLTISWIIKLIDPVFHLSSLGLSGEWLGEEVNAVSWKDMILLAGGLFLIWKSVHEIHNKLEGQHEEHAVVRFASFGAVLVEIALIDILFSLDSVITAVGMVKADPKGLAVMISAIVLAVMVMMVFSGKVSAFVERHPTLKMLALSFLILIGVMLVAEGIGTHFDRKYVYFAMAFSLVVEMLNMRARSVATKKPAATKS
jgi:predicted tellurium resistance membrane protein TerC